MTTSQPSAQTTLTIDAIHYGNPNRAVCVEFKARFATDAEAVAFTALFPKSAKIAEQAIVLHRMHPNGHALVVDHFTATYTGFGEFYSGLHNGDTVTVARSTYFRPDGSISRVSLLARTTGPWLSVDEDALSY